MFSKEEVKNLRLNFWNGFKALSAEERRKRGMKKDWILMRTGIKGLSLRFDIDRKHAGLGFEIYNLDKFKEALLFEKMESLRNILETELGQKLVWDDAFITQEDRECSRIYLEITDVDYYQQKYWDEIYTFWLRNMLILERVFLEYKDILKEY